MQQNVKGMTVLEAMVATIVLGVLLSIAVPAFHQQIQQSRLTATTNQLITAIHFARTEALRTGQRVVLCSSANQTACQTQADWHVGWIIFLDPAASGQPDGQPLRVHRFDDQTSITITGNQPVAQYISYTADGRAKLLSGALQMGTLQICGPTAGRALVLNSGGRVRNNAIDC